MDAHPIPPALERWIIEERPIGVVWIETRRTLPTAIVGGIAVVLELLLRVLTVVGWWLLMLVGIPLAAVQLGLTIRHHGAETLGNVVAVGFGAAAAYFGVVWVFGDRWLAN